MPSTVPFVGPEAQDRAKGRPFLARLGANESLFGPSPRAIEAMKQATGEVWKYGGPENHALKSGLAAQTKARRLYRANPDNPTVSLGDDATLAAFARDPRLAIADAG